MADPGYITPTYGASAFNCPHCGVLAAVQWLGGLYAVEDDGEDPDQEDPCIWEQRVPAAVGMQLARCQAPLCRRLTIWFGRAAYEHRLGESVKLNAFYSTDALIDAVMVWPSGRQGPEPNPDLPAEIRADMNEARDVLALSPRSALTLTRGALERLCAHLDANGRDLNDAIGRLVRDAGLPPALQQAADVVRVFGNLGAHPNHEADRGELHDGAVAMLGFINLLAERLISEPKHIQDWYDRLPPGARDAITRRDQ